MVARKNLKTNYISHRFKISNINRWENVIDTTKEFKQKPQNETNYIPASYCIVCSFLLNRRSPLTIRNSVTTDCTLASEKAASPASNPASSSLLRRRLGAHTMAKLRLCIDVESLCFAMNRRWSITAFKVLVGMRRKVKTMLVWGVFDYK